ncbi:hypothetical protein Focb16_v009929 [Fusarium oxysporum f. sp. cubense]|uniref:Uncharacterized protein n=1 Tax=Fusarium oxysporum f. sp. cubense TaxID=61366 RepID=A0A559L170_FUSOC|nr:hypothetical protein Focb16_v009929 [Fusarium oxysporum f. sp. cubense]
MAPPSVMFYIAPGSFIRRAYSLKSLGDAAYLELFFRILANAETCPETLLMSLEEGIELLWENVYDFVNPYGDRRGTAFESVWTFNLEKDVLLLNKNDELSSVPLKLARERLLTLDDFEPVSAPKAPHDQTLPGLYWEPKLDPLPRENKFLGQILRDFIYTWRHVIRRQMGPNMFMKMAYAITWISNMEFMLYERTGFEPMSSGGPYVPVRDLPCWGIPEEALVPTASRSSWFVLSQDLSEGLETVREHAKGQLRSKELIYTILTVRQVLLCRALGSDLEWTKPEKLFDGTSACDIAIDMLIWAANFSRQRPQKTAIHSLPIEIQDRILYFATTSFVASAKLGCELGLGSPLSWADRGVKIGLQEFKRHRFESSPVECYIAFNGIRCGLAYKREKGYGKPQFYNPVTPAVQQR